MRLYEIPFSSFYHQYIVIEADDLTEECKKKISITEDDCYALCSSYCAEDGLLMFNVLAVGTAADHCTKGLELPDMLAFYSMEDVYEKEAQVIPGEDEMIFKNRPFMERMDAAADDDLLKSRMDSRLDDLRDLFYPDIVIADIAIEGYFYEYEMMITGTEGPFLSGSLAEEPETGLGIHEGDRILALPYIYEDTIRLFAAFAGDHLSQDEEEYRQRIMAFTDALGIGFYGFSKKS